MIDELITQLTPAMNEQYLRKDYRSMWEIWEMLLKTKEIESDKFPVLPEQFHERHEDMSVHGRLSVGMDNSGDMIIAIIPDIDSHRLSLEFCTASGGGKSKEVRRALCYLAYAIQKDNSDNPIIR